MLKLDDEIAATLDLEPAGLMREPWGTVLDGPMAMRRRELWRSGDHRITVGAWECDAGRFQMLFDGEREHIRNIVGEMICWAWSGGAVALVS